MRFNEHVMLAQAYNGHSTTHRERGCMPTNKEELNSLPVLLDVETTATLLRVTPRYVRNLCASGKLKARKVGKGWKVNKYSVLELAGLAGL